LWPTITFEKPWYFSIVNPVEYLIKFSSVIGFTKVLLVFFWQDKKVIKINIRLILQGIIFIFFDF
jgi:hypothetical protein